MASRMQKKLDKASYDALPEVLHEFYQESNGAYHLLVEGDDPGTAKLKEFRDNNIALTGELTATKQALTELQSKLKGLDPNDIEGLVELRSKFEDEDDQKLIKAGKWEDVFNKRTQTMRADHEVKMRAREGEVKKFKDEADLYRNRYKRITLDDAVTKSVGRVGAVQADAMTDILNRAREAFEIGDDGSIKTKLTDNDPEGNAFTLDSWSKYLVRANPYLFESAGGSGAGMRGEGRVITGVDGKRKEVIPNDPISLGRNAKKILAGTAVQEP